MRARGVAERAALRAAVADLVGDPATVVARDRRRDGAAAATVVIAFTTVAGVVNGIIYAYGQSRAIV